ncbi:hypothetical protein APY94_00480 [Thermococcus celericrescens]|uniref:Uncharacterized protein n=1 Tax=Thermococcus celericrescens TaxID=227598 RepID=A0A100XZR7_9EURY|nr:hypothetical protein [Thermococcus celericrescens]KUH34695.1 hypothetical protein APY94_00480 [Thermococcus celericrescens]
MKAEETAVIPFILTFIGLMLSLLWGGNSGSVRENVELSFYIILAIPVALATWKAIHKVWKHTSNAVFPACWGLRFLWGLASPMGSWYSAELISKVSLRVWLLERSLLSPNTGKRKAVLSIPAANQTANQKVSGDVKILSALPHEEVVGVTNANQ